MPDSACACPIADAHARLCVQAIEIVVNSRRRMHLCMQDDQNGQKMMVLTSAEETRLTCCILLQNIFFWSNQPSLTADVNTIINLPWYPRKIVHFSLVLSPSRTTISMVQAYGASPIARACQIVHVHGRSRMHDRSRAKHLNTKLSISYFSLVITACPFSIFIM